MSVARRGTPAVSRAPSRRITGQSCARVNECVHARRRGVSVTELCGARVPAGHRRRGSSERRSGGGSVRRGGMANSPWLAAARHDRSVLILGRRAHRRAHGHHGIAHKARLGTGGWRQLITSAVAEVLCLVWGGWVSGWVAPRRWCSVSRQCGAAQLAAAQPLPQMRTWITCTCTS